jgi:hypothetical protein
MNGKWVGGGVNPYSALDQKKWERPRKKAVGTKRSLDLMSRTLSERPEGGEGGGKWENERSTSGVRRERYCNALSERAGRIIEDLACCTAQKSALRHRLCNLTLERRNTKLDVWTERSRLKKAHKGHSTTYTKTHRGRPQRDISQCIILIQMDQQTYV